MWSQGPNFSKKINPALCTMGNTFFFFVAKMQNFAPKKIIVCELSSFKRKRVQVSRRNKPFTSKPMP
jgi:hypothetical protein